MLIMGRLEEVKGWAEQIKQENRKKPGNSSFFINGSMPLKLAYSRRNY
jgi:hypothetical protein